MLGPIGLLAVVLVSVTLAVVAARGVLGGVLYFMAVTAVRPAAESSARTGASARRGFRIRQVATSGRDVIAPLVG
jgi:hypothetical protein